MRVTLEHNTVNGHLMRDVSIRMKVREGIDNPSDAIITAETSLYRIAHAQRFDRRTKAFTVNDREAAFRSPWWATNYHFNEVIWASDDPDMSNAGRAAFAIHPAWRSDCANYASIVTKTDLSVWYGLGKVVNGIDPATGKGFGAYPSADVLQIYIPGFDTHFKQWAELVQVIPFAGSVANTRGFQGNFTGGLRPGSVPGRGRRRRHP